MQSNSYLLITNQNYI